MRTLGLYRSLGPVDLRNVRRDPLLGWVLAIPLGMALLYRVGVPLLAAWLRARTGFELEAYYPLLMSFYLLLAPGMIGMVAGFLLLDERDSRVLTALRVTPVPLRAYLAYRITLPLLLGTLMTLVGYPIAGLAPIAPAPLLAVALLAAFSAPLTALFLGTFAENKVTGFAVVKVMNTLNMLPVAAYFVAAPLQLLAGVVPSYWAVKSFWLAQAGAPYAAFWWAGMGVNLLALVLLTRGFERSVA